MGDTRVTRRRVLRALAVSPLAAAALAACGKKDAPDSCQDVSALSDPDKATRSTLQYTDRAPSADKQCNKCSFYQPASEPTKCGACTLVKGPIHPNGYCSAFAPKTG
jgi:hypothetical protein